MRKPLFVSADASIEPLAPHPSVVALLTAMMEQNRLILSQNSRILDALAVPFIFTANTSSPEVLQELAETVLFSESPQGDKTDV